MRSQQMQTAVFGKHLIIMNKLHIINSNAVVVKKSRIFLSNDCTVPLHNNCPAELGRTLAHFLTANPKHHNNCHAIGYRSNVMVCIDLT